MSETPFKRLGAKLKTLRQKSHESMAEVSGAVEIDELELQHIEEGNKRPSEDVLTLLINHFDLREEDADGLYKLAGYEPPQDQDDSSMPKDSQNSRTMVMIMAVDPRIIYCDGVQINANNDGVILNFVQGVGTSQPLTTSRIGMSKTQAEKLIAALHRALEPAKPKQLPAGPLPNMQAKVKKQQPKKQDNPDK